MRLRQEEQASSQAAQKRDQIKSGGRAEKIRTYKVSSNQTAFDAKEFMKIRFRKSEKVSQFILPVVIVFSNFMNYNKNNMRFVFEEGLVYFF